MRILDRLEETLIATLIAAATIVIFIAVAHRYTTDFVVSHRSWPGAMQAYAFLSKIHLSWAQELCIFMFVWMAKFGAAYGVRTGIHVGVDVLINRLSDRNRSKFIIFGLLAGALFTGIVATLGGHFVWENGAHYAYLGMTGAEFGDVPEGPTTPDLEWSTWIVYSAIPLGSSLMCFRFLQVTWNFLKTGELPHHDHGHVDGLEDEVVAVDANPYSLDDNLHVHDLKHKPLGDHEGDRK